MALDWSGGNLILSSFYQWPTLFSIKAILLAFLFSGSVGVFFGSILPESFHAQPIEALRYE